VTAPTSSELNARLDLPRPPGLARQWMRENPHRMDGIFAGLYLLGSIGLGVLGAYIPPDGEGTLGWFVPEYVRLPQVLLLVLITVVACVALFTRRRYPLGSLIAVLAVSVFAPGDMVPAALTTSVGVILLCIARPRPPGSGTASRWSRPCSRCRSCTTSWWRTETASPSTSRRQE
jgi:hypothetical protein